MPNDKGAWTLGRGGWCNGRQVEPVVFDVTRELQAAGQTNSIVYLGLFNGTNPLASQSGGYIMLQASLAFWERSP